MQVSIVKHALPKSYLVALISNSLLYMILPPYFAILFAYLILDAVQNRFVFCLSCKCVRFNKMHQLFSLRMYFPNGVISIIFFLLLNKIGSSYSNASSVSIIYMYCLSNIINAKILHCVF
jgi:hypothetical protein